jgi:putative transposase
MYPSYRYPAQIISHIVWLYFRFTLSYHDIEKLLTVRGGHFWLQNNKTMLPKFWKKYSHQVNKSRGQLGDTWYLDEVFIRINGIQYYLGRAVDQD